MLIALADGQKYAQEITAFMYDGTNGAMQVKEQSLYRALRRFTSLKLTTVNKMPSSEAGPDRKYYELTSDGRAVLRQFANLHITPLLAPKIQTIIKEL